MNQIQTWLSKRRQQREAQRESFARTVARRLWEERTGGDAPQPDPDEAERQAALKDWHTADFSSFLSRTEGSTTQICSDVSVFCKSGDR